MKSVLFLAVGSHAQPELIQEEAESQKQIQGA